MLFILKIIQILYVSELHLTNLLYVLKLYRFYKPNLCYIQMWNKLFSCLSETTLEISQEDNKSNSKSLKNSLNNLANGSYTNLATNQEQQLSIVQKLANSTGYLNKLNSSPDKKKLSETSTTITMATNTIGSTSKKKLVSVNETAPQFSRKQNEIYAQ